MPRGRMGGRHGMSTEKAKDFKGTMKKLMGYLTQYKMGLLLVVIFAIGRFLEKQQQNYFMD